MTLTNVDQAQRRRQLLNAYREHTDYESSRAAATWSQLEQRVAGGEAPRFSDVTAARRPMPLRALGAALAIAAGLTLVWGLRGMEPRSADDVEHAGPADAASYASEQGAQGEAVRKPGGVGSTSARIEVEAPPVADVVTPQEPGPLSPSVALQNRDHGSKFASPTSRRLATRPAVDDGDMTRELGLLREAQTALGRSAFQGALAVLQRHARQFPQGRLAPEREALRAVALCSLGDATGGRVAQKFLNDNPHSSLRGRVETTCTLVTDELAPRPTQIPGESDK